jgi:hypothetical protein
VLALAGASFALPQRSLVARNLRSMVMDRVHGFGCTGGIEKWLTQIISRKNLIRLGR